MNYIKLSHDDPTADCEVSRHLCRLSAKEGSVENWSWQYSGAKLRKYAFDLGRFLLWGALPSIVNTELYARLEPEDRVAIITIHRGSLWFTISFLRTFQNAAHGDLLIQRSEVAPFEPVCLYSSIPIINGFYIVGDIAFATGGTGVKAVTLLRDQGIGEDRIIFIAGVTTAVGRELFASYYPNIKFFYGMEAAGLDDNAYIIDTDGRPVLGDIGDRLAGTL